MTLNSQNTAKKKKRMNSSFNDPIAELLTKIRNAKMAQHCHVDLNSSKTKKAILEILKEKGFIQNYIVTTASSDTQSSTSKIETLRVFLRYTKNRESVIRGLKRESTSGLRKYVCVQDIPRVFNGMGIAILSTSKGILEGEAARQAKMGGEIMCTVW